MTSIDEEPLAVVSRLIAARPVIEHILSICGTVGLSYGVIHHGKLVHMDNFGFRDLEKKVLIDEETMFPICSMTKGLVSSTLGLLVEDAKLEWDTPVHEIVSAYAPRTEHLRSSATLVDWMSMRTGLESYQPWFQSHNNIIFDESDCIKIINSLQPVADLRARFHYSNWGYELAAQAIRELTGESWDTLLHSRIFEPLGLQRTDARGKVDEYDNVSESYTVLDDGRPVHIKRTGISGATLNGAAGGVKSCVKDLLALYHAMLQAAVHQFESGMTSTPGSPFKQLHKTMSAQIPLPGPSLRESTYGLGWLRTQLPNVMFKISPNLDQLGEAPVLGVGAQSRLLIAHYGSMPGACCGVNLFPESESVIVVLSNSTPMCDISDWTLQLLTQTVFDFPTKHDYVMWTRKTVDNELGWHGRLVSDLEARRAAGTHPRDLKEYTGSYLNTNGTFIISVALKEDSLQMSFQARKDETFSLKHYQHDSFCWLESRNELVSRGRWVLQPADYYIFRFAADNDDKTIDRFFWANDPEVPNGEEFQRKKML